MVLYSQEWYQKYKVAVKRARDKYRQRLREEANKNREFNTEFKILNKIQV